MNGEDRSAAPDPGDVGVPPAADRKALAEDQAAADGDRGTAAADQAAADIDQALSARDDADALRDQRSADRDQETADAIQAEAGREAIAAAYAATRAERVASRVDRLATHVDRAGAAEARLQASRGRDRTASRRDDAARRRDLRAAGAEQRIAASDAPLGEQFERLRDLATQGRAAAAADRARAAAERTVAAAERTSHAAELRAAHLDDLTGAFRRAAGRDALTLEIARARRGDGRFVLVFVDVDDLKGVNDRAGHATGDLVLRTLVATIRSRLRSFDPVVRHGGDEFVCAVGGVDVDEVERRFDGIRASLYADTGVEFSVGLAVLAEGDTLDALTERADEALLDAKRARPA
jgi:diguanylate cyclase (GGDEF)-like protein